MAKGKSVPKISINLKKIAFFLLPAAIIIGILVFFRIWANHHFINAFLVKENLSFKSFESVKNSLSQKISAYLNQDFKFTIGEKITEAKLSDAGINIDVEKNLRDILEKQNYSDKYYLNLFKQVGSFFYTSHYDLNVSIDEEKFEKFAKEKIAKLLDRPKNAFIEKAGGEFILHKGKNGRKIGAESMIKDMITAASKLEMIGFIVTTMETEPDIKDAAAKETFDEALSLINNKSFKLKYKDEVWPVPKEVIYDIISFKESSDKIIIEPNLKEIEDFLSQIAPQIARKPINAVLKFDDNNNAIIKQEDLSGREIEIKETLNSFIIAFNKKIAEIEIAVKEIPASLRKDNYLELGINSLLGQGKTNFSGSAASRVHNIKVGAAKFNGILLSSNEEFSFNKNLGEIGPEQGYLPGLVIKDKKTVPEYGGGLCQVSTTLFQAAVKAGLKITKRSPHAYPVAFYNPPGFDAAIYSPYTDLKFVNITNGYIYIQSEVKGNEIYFNVFGPNDGNQVKLKGPVTYEKNDDGSMKTVLTQEVYDKENNLLFKKSFYSNYKSPSLYPILRNPLE